MNLKKYHHPLKRIDKTIESPMFYGFVFSCINLSMILCCLLFILSFNTCSLSIDTSSHLKTLDDENQMNMNVGGWFINPGEVLDMMTSPHLYGGAMGGESISGGMSGIGIGGDRGSEEILDMGVIFERLDQGAEDMMPPLVEFSPLLPEPNCLIYNELTSSCVLWNYKSRADICELWSDQYPPTAPNPWSGDRGSCELGTHDPNGVRDLERLLSLYRALLHLPSVSVVEETEMTKCALIFDVMVEERVNEFVEGVRCYTPENRSIFDLPDRLSLFGNWSLFKNLETALSLNIYGDQWENLIHIRHYFLNPQLSTLGVGARGIASCLRTVERNVETNSSSSLPFIFFPGVGNIPLETVRESNHHLKRVPWSIQWFGGSNIQTTLNVTRIEGTERTPFEGELLGPFHVNGIIASLFIPNQPPTPNVIYETQLRWEEGGQPNSLLLYTSFTDCGFIQPDQCTSIPDNCQIDGTHCSAQLLDEELQWLCLWNGPIEQGQSCSSNNDCADGVCGSEESNGENSSCLQPCTLESDHPQSCESICSEPPLSIAQYNFCF